MASTVAYGFWGACPPGLIREMLGKDHLNVEGMQEVHNTSFGPLTLVHSVAKKVGDSLARMYAEKSRECVEERTPLYRSWNDLFREFVVAGIDVHRNVGCRSPFSMFLEGYMGYSCIYDRIMENCDIALKVWLTDLQTFGLDLEELGRTQKQLMDNEEVDQTYHVHDFDPFPGRGVTRRLISIFYGPSPSDWRLWWSGLSDLYFEDFWHLVERQTEVIAGAWPEDTPYKML